MASRRALLAAVATSATGGGCATLVGTQGTPGSFRDDWARAPDDADIVARSVDDAEGAAEGSIRTVGTAYENTEPHEVVLVSEHRVRAGALGSSSGWEHSGIEVTHDWTAGGRQTSLVSYSSNTPQTDDADPDVRTRNHTSGEIGHWEVTQTRPSDSVTTYRFRSTGISEREPATGEDLLATGATARFAESGWFGESSELAVDLSLTYGERDPVR